MKFLPSLFFFLLLISSVIASAQIPESSLQDFQTWSSVEIQNSFSKKLKGSLEEQLRLKDNSTRLRQVFTDAGLKYEAFKNFNVSANYRFIIKPDETDHRIYSDLSYDYENKDWDIEPRVRLQHEFDPGLVDKNYIRPKIEIRNRLDKQWKLFVSAEFFYRIFYYKGNEFDEYRLSGGGEYNFNKKNSLKLFYLLQQEFNVNAPEQNHVLGISYQYKL